MHAPSSAMAATAPSRSRNRNREFRVELRDPGAERWLDTRAFLLAAGADVARSRRPAKTPKCRPRAAAKPRTPAAEPTRSTSRQHQPVAPAGSTDWQHHCSARMARDRLAERWLDTRAFLLAAGADVARSRRPAKTPKCRPRAAAKPRAPAAEPTRSTTRQHQFAAPAGSTNPQHQPAAPTGSTDWQHHCSARMARDRFVRGPRGCYSFSRSLKNFFAALLRILPRRFSSWRSSICCRSS